MPNLPGLFFLKNYPSEEIWRLFVDGRFWSKEKGWQGYESREPGSLNAALESLCSIAFQVDQSGANFELSTDLIKDIHKKCGKKVEELEDKSPGEIRTDEPVSFGIPTSRASVKGIEEFSQLSFLIEGGAEFGPGEHGFFRPTFTKNYFKNLSPDQIPELAHQIYEDMSKGGHSESTHFFLAVCKNVDVYLEKITQSYNKEIKEAKTVDEKLKVIAKHIRHYEVLHPFRDANGRTFVNNLLNILLMQQGLPPATFYEPNVFDLYSADELVDVIKEAIFNTTEIINKKNNSLYGYTSTPTEKNNFAKLLDSPSFNLIQDMEPPGLEAQQVCVERTKECLATLNEKHPLHWGAIYCTDSSDIKSLIKANASQINKCIKQGAPPIYVGRTPIHMAIRVGNRAMFDALLVNEADLSIPDYDGKTVFHYAAEYGNLEIMEKLLASLLSREEAIKVLGSKDRQGKTAFHYAAEFGSPEIVKTLRDTNAVQINEKDSAGTSPLTLAYKNRKLTIFDTLLNSGADIDDELLDMVMGRNDRETLERIIAKNDKLLTSKTAFIVAIKMGSVDAVRKFLQAGMDIDAVLNADNATPLMIATRFGNVKLVEYLLRNGAQTDVRDQSGDSVLHYVFYASPANRKELIELITAKDATLVNKLNANKRSPLHSAVISNDLVLTNMLLKSGARLDFVDSMGDNCLHTAMGYSDLLLISEIVSRDSSLLRKINTEGRNPVHQELHRRSVSPSKVGEKKCIALVDYLLRENIELNTKDIKGKTLLDLALENKYYLLCSKLIRAGAQTNIDASASILKNADADSILKQPAEFKITLIKNLNENPLIALAQLNDLYLQIQNKNIKTPKGYWPKSGFTLFKGKSEDDRAHDQVLAILKDIYDNTLKSLVSGTMGESKDKFNSKPQLLDENLKSLINCEQISKKISKPDVQIVEGATVKIKW